MQADELSKTIAEALSKEAGKAQKAINVAASKSAREGAKKLRATSPVRTGRYASKWSSTKELRYGGLKTTIYNRPPTYRIAHLLEKGTPVARARVHIKPVEEETIKSFERIFIKEFEK